ncbi:hypothetical protein [Chryseolinea lacunae]|uniref:Uncharacterized protein n=1 Tax=Chryseolinea lacunae TaxID=2801331 RepID=A0ABS1KLX9_9BACT|nr:hypothetical protein [Chryseolinea lacunae]MBL0740474.1 hypothetical protein [Chryseolinea lacunae]
MDINLFSTMTPTAYLSLWNKYRPAIIHLMLAASEGPQQYKLYAHEFKALAPKEKSFSFVLHAHLGKAKNNIKNSITAQDLLSMLNMSRKASEQLAKNTFEFTLDNRFVLHIVRVPVVEQPLEAESEVS